MKNIIIISIITLAATALISCNTERTNDGQSGVEAKFSTSITRASGNLWDANDRIGITMVEHGTALPQGYQNAMYTTTVGDGSFTATDAARIYFPVATDPKMGFIAYYPYTTTNINGFLYSVDVSNQSSPQSIDLMSAQSIETAPAGYDKNSPNVLLRFRHRLSRLIVVASAGTGITDLTGLTVIVNGLPTTASYDISTNTFSTIGNSAPISLTNVDGTFQYEAIVIPTTVDTEGQVSLSFNLGGQTYTWVAPIGTLLESGQEHTWSILVARIPTLINTVIEPWGDGEDGTGDAI